MARARNIKPGLFVNDDLAELHPLTRLMFIGLWTIADREGRLEDKPKKIAAQVLPYDDHDVDSALSDLEDAGFIERYTVKETQYIQVVNFSKHQNPHKNEAPSSIPAPEQHRTSTVQAPEQHTTNPADSLNLIPDSLQYGSSATPPNPVETEFDELWKIYPKRSGSNPKNKAFAAYQKSLKRKHNHADIKAGLERYRRWCETTGKIGQETVMQGQRFFGPGREWEQDFGAPAEKIKLPWDNQALWKIRAAIGLEAFYDCEAKACHAEILAHLQQHPEHRQTVLECGA